MSVTGHSDVRHPDDFYATPRWCVRAILPHLGSLEDRSILEPGCGEGAIIAALPQEARLIVGVEMNAERAGRAQALGRGIVHCANYLEWASTAEPYDLAIGNPPFKDAMEFVRATVRIAHTTAMLLRLPWLASQRRANWLREHTPSVYVLPKRPSFTGKGTDATDYAWMVWRPDVLPTVRILEISED